MMLLRIIVLSPLLAAAVAVVVYMSAKWAHLPKPRATYLVRLSLTYAAIGASVSLLLTIVWMNWYEGSTGISAGNAPIGWIFFSGPLSAALGQLAALSRWWFTKPLTN
jgi:hypothetical protein